MSKKAESSKIKSIKISSNYGKSVDIAGGVTISQIARVPAGFDVYQNLAIREIAFYQPREIYRGQRTVDNVRALRSLGQDARHQEMVDQQYRR